MSWPWRAALFILGLLALLLPVAFQRAPGYMDAEYYFIGGQRLAQGQGFSELVLWNYLDDPIGLPHPSHGYWMPLPSLLAAAGMLLTGQADFVSGRLGFILLAAFIPVLSAELCLALTASPVQARLAGGLALASGFYLAYLPTTDSFSLVMLTGGLFFFVLNRLSAHTGRSGFRFALATGLLAGLMHLCRADGLLWLAGGAMAVLWSCGWTWRRPFSGWKPALAPLVGLALGYALVFGPWALRNLVVFGTPLAPGGARGAWLTSYNDLFSYPASRLTLARWLESGWSAILTARVEAFGQHLLSTWAVQGLVFILPLILTGAWQLRRSLPVRTAALVWILLLAVMCLVFPFQGINGGFFHSAAALQPLWWALAPLGLERFMAWGAAHRGWQPSRSRPVFQGLLLLIAALLTVVTMFGRVVGADAASPAWNRDWQRYLHTENFLKQAGAQPGQVVMVNSPPGYYAASQRPAVVLPFSDLSTLHQVARRYAAHYLLIDIDQVWGESLASRPGDRPGLRYLGRVEDLQVYEFLP